MKRVHQNWYCQDTNVTCSEITEDCSACDGTANITNIHENYELKHASIFKACLPQKCSPGVTVEGETTETMELPCNKKVT